MILLLEADANMNYKKLGCDLMKYSERTGNLAPDNFGGRKNHRAIEVVLNERLTKDIFRQKRKAAAKDASTVSFIPLLSCASTD